MLIVVKRFISLLEKMFIIAKISFIILVLIAHLSLNQLTAATDNQNKEQKSFEEENYGVKYADDCEVCKYVTIEFEDRLKETGKTTEVLETGYSFDKEKKKTEYKKSELRFIETMENVCDRLLSYNVHKERKDSTRFAKGISQTFQTLNNLVDRGVKVDLGIPQPMWDKPSAEISDLKTKCERLLEKYENEIEEWYWKNEEESNLTDYLCVNRALKGKETKCLSEKLIENKSTDSVPEEVVSEKTEL